MRAEILFVKVPLSLVDARRIVEQKLPTLSGIQHDGYKLICLAALDNAQKAYTSKDKNEWKRKISAIKNTADEAFVYFSIAPFFFKQSDMKEFFEKGISKRTDAEYSSNHPIQL